MSIKKKLFDYLDKQFYPHIYFFPSPFKIYEYREMKRAAQLDRSHRVLDIGCGHGLQTRLMATEADEVVGIDIGEGAIGWAKSLQAKGRDGSRCQFLQTRIEDAGFAPDSFDRVMSVCVLEHIPDDESVLRECFRVLKPGGKLIFSIDSLATLKDLQIKETHRERYAVCQYYEPAAIREKLEAAGFGEVSVRPLLGSDLARRWFEQAIQREFRFRYSEAVLRYWLLRVVEAWRKPDKGIYLLIAGTKPA